MWKKWMSYSEKFSEKDKDKDNPGMLKFWKGRTTWQEKIKPQAAMVIDSCFVACLPNPLSHKNDQN